MNSAGLDAMRQYAIESGMIKNAPKQNTAPVAPVQLYRPGIPFAPTDTVPALPISDEDAAALERGEIRVTFYGERGVMSRAVLRAMYETLAGIAAR